MSNEGEQLLCGACGTAVDRAGDWFLCDHCGDSLHIQSVKRRPLLGVAAAPAPALAAPKKAKKPAGGPGRAAKTQRGGALSRTQ